MNPYVVSLIASYKGFSMAGRVFISCGQAKEEERKVGSQLRDYFAEHGFRPYVAIEAQSIQDVNSALLRRNNWKIFPDH